MMRRREFITILGGTLSWPIAARAQSGERTLRRIGVLMGIADDQEGQARLTALKQGLQESGWTDARNIQINVRWGGGDIGQIRADAAELVNTRPDIILVYSTRVLNAMRQATQNIPVVFLATSDPVGLGYVKSLAHPGGNLTGFMLYEVSVAGKLVELLKEIIRPLRGWAICSTLITSKRPVFGVRSRALRHPWGSFLSSFQCGMRRPFKMPSIDSPATGTVASCCRWT